MKRPWGIADLRPPVLPRGGVVRPGEKVRNDKDKEYPRELDYFNVEDAPALKEVSGEKPRLIRGMFASDRIQEVVDLGYKKWHQNNTIACRGDGRVAIDLDTGEERECLGEDCEMVVAAKCKRQITIAFLPIDAPTIAVHTFTSTGWKTINNTLAFVNLLQTMYGRLAGIEWTMHREPFKVERETADGKKINQVHYTIRFDIEKPLRELIPIAIASQGKPAAFDTCEPTMYPKSIQGEAGALPPGETTEQAYPDPVTDLLHNVPEPPRQDIIKGFDITGRTNEQQFELLTRYKDQPEKLLEYLHALADGMSEGKKPETPVSHGEAHTDKGWSF